MQVNIINLKHAFSIYKEMCVILFILQKNILCLKVGCFVLLDLTESVRRRQHIIHWENSSCSNIVVTSIVVETIFSNEKNNETVYLGFETVCDGFHK